MLCNIMNIYRNAYLFFTGKTTIRMGKKIKVPKKKHRFILLKNNRFGASGFLAICDSFYPRSRILNVLMLYVFLLVLSLVHTHTHVHTNISNTYS
jgi:hypothetical protein